MKNILAIIAALLLSVFISAFGYTFIFSSGEIITNPDIKYFISTNVSYLRIFILIVSMLLGIAAKAMTDQIDLDRRKTLKTVSKKAINSPAFMYSIIVSPIIFFSIYSIAGQLPDDVIAFCISFQNGFFFRFFCF